jgi:Spy/CpxP family protein refolding chaperone
MKPNPILTTLSAAAVLAFAACNKTEPKTGPAGGPPSGPGRPFAHEGGPGKPHGDRLKEALGLSEEQADKLKAIHEKEREKAEALRAETRKQVEAVLTKEQVAKMQELRERMKDRPHGFKGHPGGPEGKFGHRPDPRRMLERMKEHLALTDDQVKKIEAVFEKQKQAALALKKDGPDKPDREAFQALRESAKTQIEAILTAEQKAKMAELRDRHPGSGGPAHKDAKRPKLAE